MIQQLDKCFLFIWCISIGYIINPILHCTNQFKIRLNPTIILYVSQGVLQYSFGSIHSSMFIVHVPKVTENQSVFCASILLIFSQEMQKNKESLTRIFTLRVIIQDTFTSLSITQFSQLVPRKLYYTSIVSLVSPFFVCI